MTRPPLPPRPFVPPVPLARGAADDDDDDFGEAANATHRSTDALGFREGIARQRATLEWTDARGAHATRVENRAVLGSSERADLPVADPSVSRLHAELEPRPDGLWVRDLRSTNGTYVQGVRVTEARLPDGARMQVGGTVITVRYAAHPSPVELWSGERFGPLVGRSVAMRELFSRLARVAAVDATVLVAGETGSGKELVARAIHEASARGGSGGGTAPRAPGGPYVVVDCAALPDALLEAELFGHAKGAFTGAATARTGAIESAEGGTVFLDEIGELPLAMQPKLLRVLESGTVRRVGETAWRPVNVRFIAATHRDLRAMVNAGAFREDLYFRLAVLTVSVPPLRERAEDIPLLIEHFVPGGAAGAFEPQLLAELASRPWPGNVRELRNFVQRALAFGASEALAQAADAAPAPGTAATAAAGAASAPGAAEVGIGRFGQIALDRPFKDLREEWIAELERIYITALLRRHDGNVSAVAAASGLHRTHVHRLIRKLGL